VEHPLDAGARAGQIQQMAQLRRLVRSADSSVELVADEWANTIADIRAFNRAGAADMIQIKTPDLGGLHHSVEAVLDCRAHGVLAHIGGSCCETDRSARACVHLAMATGADQILAKPGMGVDEGLSIVGNEMARTLRLESTRAPDAVRLGGADLAHAVDGANLGCAVGGPWFEDLHVGQVFTDAPGLTLTEGHAALHQAIVGDRMKLSLDAALSRAVVGEERTLVHPALAWDVAIGQSTTATQRVIANLFYRGLAFRRAPLVGDTLRTLTEVVALRQSARRPNIAARGLAALHVTTVDQQDRLVLDFWRCAMLPLRDPDGSTGAADDIDAVTRSTETGSPGRAVEGWRLSALRDAVPGPGFGDLAPGATWTSESGAVVSAAPELARLTLNIAMAHHDRLRPGAEGRRLVYGGHSIGVAAAFASRALPTLATITAWHSCDHLAPVGEGDTLYSRLTLECLEPLPGGGGLAHLRARVQAADEADRWRDVLDWRFVAALA
jgi:acyl dehydratase